VNIDNDEGKVRQKNHITLCAGYNKTLADISSEAEFYLIFVMGKYSFSCRN
jgi:hypothetical protein